MLSQHPGNFLFCLLCIAVFDLVAEQRAQLHLHAGLIDTQIRTGRIIITFTNLFLQFFHAFRYDKDRQCIRIAQLDLTDALRLRWGSKGTYTLHLPETDASGLTLSFDIADLDDGAVERGEYALLDGQVILTDRNGETASASIGDFATVFPALPVYADKLFCRERWIKVKVGKTGEELEQRLIVTFSFKYRDYLRHVRDKQIARAEGIIRNGAAGRLGKGQNDPRRFIRNESCTSDGELAQYSSYSLNQEMIDQEARFDGFYGICTDLEDNAAEIIRMNGGRWIIEDCFRITKTDFEARPVFLRRDDRITAHFLTCFLALILYKYLARKVNRGGRHFSPDEIISTLQDMNFLCIPGEGYIPTYTRTDLSNNLHGSAGFRTDTQIVTKKTMRSIIALTKVADDMDNDCEIA